MRIAVLVGAARHPFTQVPCRGRDDASAVELALRIAAPHTADLRLLHQGSPDEPSLRAYFGMGVARILVLPPASVLAGYLAAEAFDLIVTGARSGCDTGDGLLPYRLAATLDAPLIANVVDARPDGAGWEVAQYRPRGARRFVAVDGPAIVTVGEGGPPPRQSAFARARAGRVEAIPQSDAIAAAAAAAPNAWTPRAARERAVAAATPAGSAADRRRALLQPAAAGGRLVADRPVAEMARELLQQLEQLGIREK